MKIRLIREEDKRRCGGGGGVIRIYYMLDVVIKGLIINNLNLESFKGLCVEVEFRLKFF